MILTNEIKRKIIERVAPGKTWDMLFDLPENEFNAVMHELDMLGEQEKAEKQRQADFDEKRKNLTEQTNHEVPESKNETKKEYEFFATRFSQTLVANHTDDELQPQDSDENDIVDPAQVRRAKVCLAEHGIVSLSAKSFSNFLTNKRVDTTSSYDNTTDEASVSDAHTGSYHCAALRYMYSYTCVILLIIAEAICGSVYLVSEDLKKFDKDPVNTALIGFIFSAAGGFMFNTFCACVIRFTLGATLMPRSLFSCEIIKISDVNKRPARRFNAIARTTRMINKLLHGPLFFVWHIVSFMVATWFLSSLAWPLRVFISLFAAIELTIITVSLITITMNWFVGWLADSFEVDLNSRIKISCVNDSSVSCVYSPRNAVYSWREAAEMICWIGIAQVILDYRSSKNEQAEQIARDERQAVTDAITGNGEKLRKNSAGWFV